MRAFIAVLLLLASPVGAQQYLLVGPGPVPGCAIAGCRMTGNITLATNGSINGPGGTIQYINNNSPWLITADPIVGSTYADNTVSLRNNTYITVGNVTATVGDTRASFTGVIAPNTFNTSTLTVTGWSGGIIVVGSKIQGAGVNNLNRVLSQSSGTTGQNGVYIISGGNQTVGSEAMQALYGTLTVSAVSTGSVSVGNWLIGGPASGQGPIPRTVKVLQSGTGSGGTGTYYVNTTGYNMPSTAIDVGSALGQDSIRMLSADGSELSAIFQNPQQNSNFSVGTGSINGGDIYGRGFGIQMSYATSGNFGPLPDGQNYLTFLSGRDGHIELNTMNGTSTSGYINRFQMVGGTGSTQGYIGIGAGASTSLTPLFPLHMMGKQLLADSDGTGTHSIWLTNNGTAILGSSDSGISIVLGTNTPGSGTTVATIDGTGSGTITAGTFTSNTNVNVNGHLNTGGGTPAPSSCGNSPSVSGTDVAGVITVGTGVVTACTLTWATAYLTNSARCVANAVVGGVPVAVGTSSATLTTNVFATAATVAGGSITYMCIH